MHLITTDGEVVPCGYDQGTGLWVVKLRDYCDDDDYEILNLDGEEITILDWDFAGETRRVLFLSLKLEGDSDSETDSDDESAGSDEDDSYSETEGSEEEELGPGDDEFDYTNLNSLD